MATDRDRGVLADLLVRANTVTLRAQLKLVRFVFSLLNGPRFSFVADREMMRREWVLVGRAREVDAYTLRLVP